MNNIDDGVEYDYDGEFDFWQTRIDAAGIDFDVSTLCGLTEREIDGWVNHLIARKLTVSK